MALSTTKIEQIKSLFKKGLTEQEICTSVGISRNTARKYRPKKNEQRQLENEQFERNVQEVINVRNEEWLERLRKDDRQYKLTNIMLDLLTDEDMMRNEIQKNGIRNIVGAYKIITETGIKLAQHHTNPTGQTTVVDNNITEIVKLMNNAEEKQSNPNAEIEEFKKEYDTVRTS